MFTNNVGETVITENDAVEALLKGSKLSTAVSEDTGWLEKYNASVKGFGLRTPLTYYKAYTGDTDNYVIDCISESNWNMPDKYKTMDIVQHLLDLTNNEQEYQRVVFELNEFQERGMIPVLKYLVYLTDVAAQNNIVLGVGRGSSVASYVLYLLGVHKINSLDYDLDIKEFLK